MTRTCIATADTKWPSKRGRTKDEAVLHHKTLKIASSSYLACSRFFYFNETEKLFKGTLYPAVVRVHLLVADKRKLFTININSTLTCKNISPSGMAWSYGECSLRCPCMSSFSLCMTTETIQINSLKHLINIDKVWMNGWMDWRVYQSRQNS